MNNEKLQDHAFVIDTLARLLNHISTSDDDEVGNKEILYALIAKELQFRSEQILKT